MPVDEADVVKMVLIHLEKGVQPMVSNQARMLEMLTNLSAILQKVVELQTQNPTRQNLMDATHTALKDHADDVMEYLREHDKGCTSRWTQADAADAERGAKIVAQAMERIAAVGNVAAQAAEMTQKMHDAYHKLIWTIRIAVGIGVGMFGYMAFVLEKMPK